MRAVVVDRWSVLSLGRRAFVCLLLSAFCQIACSIPNLEKPQCTAGRDVVKRFYSFHFGNEMIPSPENLKAREKFLTSGLFQELSALPEQKTDYFTATDDYPRAFRVGECTADSEDRVTLQVVLLWRNDKRTEQKEVKVEAVNTGGKWLINRVFN